MIHSRIHAFVLASAFAVCAISPLAAQSELIKLEAVASYYGAEFNGHPTSSGELFNMNDLTAAHKTLPFGTMLEVTNLENGKKVVVRVNDRGPFAEERELDVSKAAAEILGMITTGTARVSIRKVAGTESPTVTDESNTKPVTNSTPTVTAQVLPKNPTTTIVKPNPVVAGVAWRIQLGSFSREENATRLVIKLRKNGFNPAFEKTPTMIRVVLNGIADSELPKIKEKLATAGYSDFVIRQESW